MQEKQEQHELSNDQVLLSLQARFPAQGFSFSGDQGANAPIVFKQVLTFATVYDLAKQGRFEDIRPDILVPNFRDIQEIYHHNLALNSEVSSTQKE